jgi:hypothetical protein
MAGCSRVAIAPLLQYPPQQPITVALPYVEAVHIPAEIHAGQPFAIEFELSCEQFPDALRTPARPFAPTDLAYDYSELYPSHFLSLVLYRDVSQIAAAQPLRTQVSFDISGLNAGEQNLSFGAARNRSEGGMQVLVDRSSWFPVGWSQAPFDHVITFTVLP